MHWHQAKNEIKSICQHTKKNLIEQSVLTTTAHVFLSISLFDLLSCPTSPASIPPHVIHCLTLSSPPQSALYFPFASMPWKGTSTQSLTLRSKKSPERGAEETVGTFKKKRKEKNRTERNNQGDGEQRNHVCNYPVVFSDRHSNQDWERKREGLSRRERATAVLEPRTSCVQQLLTSLWGLPCRLVPRNLAREVYADTPTQAPGKASKQACDPRSVVHTPFFYGRLHPHLHTYTRTLPRTVVLVFVTAQVLQGKKKGEKGELNKEQWRNANLQTTTDRWRSEIGEEEILKRMYFNEIEIVFLILDEGGFPSILIAIYPHDSSFSR